MCQIEKKRRRSTMKKTHPISPHISHHTLVHWHTAATATRSASAVNTVNWGLTCLTLKYAVLIWLYCSTFGLPALHMLIHSAYFWLVLNVCNLRVYLFAHSLRSKSIAMCSHSLCVAASTLPSTNLRRACLLLIPIATTFPWVMGIYYYIYMYYLLDFQR